MKNHRRILSLFLAVIMVTALFVAAPVSEAKKEAIPDSYTFPLEEKVEIDVGDDNKVESEGGCGVEEGFDLEKGTLGEWFNYLELHLPKQIIDATEEMIVGMRKKAERVHEYMLEQRKAKGKVLVG